MSTGRTMNKAAATTAAYRRSHGKDPRGQGSWAFQRSTTRNAYVADTYGPTNFFSGTYTEARRKAEAAHADAPYTAVQP